MAIIPTRAEKDIPCVSRECPFLILYNATMRRRPAWYRGKGFSILQAALVQAGGATPHAYCPDSQPLLGGEAGQQRIKLVLDAREEAPAIASHLAGSRRQKVRRQAHERQSFTKACHFHDLHIHVSYR